MKIHYLSGSQFPSESANAVHVAKMCAALSEHADVTLFASGNPTETDRIYETYAIPRQFRTVLIEPPGPPLQRLHKHLRFLRALREEPAPDLYYGRHPLWVWLSTWRGVPVVYEMHRLPRSKVERLVTRAILRSDRFRGIVVISQALKRDVIAEYPHVGPGNVLVAPDAADLPVDSTTESTGSAGGESPDRFVVGYVGSLYPGRGIDVLLQVAERLPDFRFHIVGGNSSQVSSWRESCRAANVVLRGHLPHRAIPRCLEDFDVLVAPYQRSVEVPDGGDTVRWMSPMKIFEYMSAGKAIVASDLPVLREILVPEVNALLVPPDDVGRWTEAIGRLAEDEDLRTGLGQTALANLRARYTWRIRAKNVLDWIGRAPAPHAQPGP